MYRWVEIVRTLVVACASTLALAAAADDESARLEAAKLILVESGQYAATEVVMQQALGSALAPLRGQLEPSLGACTDAASEEVTRVLNARVTAIFADDMSLEALAQPYADNFTAAELVEMLEFTRSPLGVKAASVATELGLAAAKSMETMMVSTMGGLQEELTVIMQNIAANPDTCGSPTT
jgi:hypothetical protein